MKRAWDDPLFVAIVVIGGVLSVVLAVLTHNRTHEEATRWLDERAQFIARATEDTVAGTFADLQATASYLETVDDVTQDQFTEFVQRMGLDPGIIGIGYLDIVPSGELDEYLEQARRDIPRFDVMSFDGLGSIAPNHAPRETYYVLRYVSGGPFMDLVISRTPISSESEMLGFDLGTDLAWFAAAQPALSIKHPSVSNLVDVGGGFTEKAFGVVHPLLDEDGEVAGILIAGGLEALITVDVEMDLDPNVTWTVENSVLGPDLSEWPVWRRTLDLPGAPWTITVEPTNGVPDGLAWQSHWLVLALGLVLTGALASTERQIQLRREEHSHVDRLRQVAEDKDRFLATVSHELRTPLTVVIGLAAELAGNDQFSDVERHELLHLIDRNGQDAASIVEDLLVAARSDINRLAVVTEPVDLAVAIPMALAASPFDGVRISGDYATVSADLSRVQQILRNLLTNADRYGGPDVEIRLATTDTHASITVADNGQPIPANREHAIFDPYVSAHDNGNQLGSIGLGLFISRKLARLMDGDLIYRHDGTYGQFELTLPLARAEGRGASANGNGHRPARSRPTLL